MGLLDSSYYTVNGAKPRKSDRQIPGQEMNIRGLLDAATNIPVVGDALSGGMAIYDAAKGDYPSAAMNALGVLPFVTAGTVKGVGKAADALSGKKLTEFEQRHLTAQKNAALPVEQGGLGLPADNTAMQRADALGYNTPAYHATQADVDKFKKTTKTPYGDRFFFSPDASYASQYADVDASIAGNTDKVKAWKAKNAGDAGPNVMPVLLKNGEFKDWTHISPEYVVRDPSAVRSRFAAFDPMRRHEADLLGYADPYLLGSIGAGGLFGLGGYMAYKNE